MIFLKELREEIRKDIFLVRQLHLKCCQNGYNLADPDLEMKNYWIYEVYYGK